MKVGKLRFFISNRVQSNIFHYKWLVIDSHSTKQRERMYVFRYLHRIMKRPEEIILLYMSKI